MEEEDNIIVKWAQEDVETSYNLLNKQINYNKINIQFCQMEYIFILNLFMCQSHTCDRTCGRSQICGVGTAA